MPDTEILVANRGLPNGNLTREPEMPPLQISEADNRWNKRALELAERDLSIPKKRQPKKANLK